MQLVLGQKFCAALIRWPLYFPNSMVSLSLHARAQMVGVAHNGQPRPQRLRHRGSSRCARAAWTASTQSAVLRKYVRRGGFPQSVSGWHSVCRTTAHHDEIGRNKFLRRAYRSESTQRRPGPKTPHFGLEHIGLTVDNLDAAPGELKSKATHFTVEPVTFTPGIKIAFVQAPQGVLVELIQRDR